MKSIKKFFKIIFSLFVSPHGTLSSKRTTGFLMISLAGYLIYTACLKEKEIQANNTTLIRDLIYGGVGLVGSSAGPSSGTAGNSSATIITTAIRAAGWELHTGATHGATGAAR
jgi:hypothetical protein